MDKHKKETSGVPSHIPTKREEISLPARIGLVFLKDEDHELGFDQYACSYFILQLNRVQSLFEYSVVHLEEGINELTPLPNTDKMEIMSNWIEENTKGYVYSDSDFWAGITSQPFSNGWFFQYFKTGSIITSADWEKEYSPPSVFEYLAHAVIMCSIYALSQHRGGTFGSHRPTKGCIFDFTTDKRDRKITVASEFICSECKENIIESLGEDGLEEIEKMITKEWMGTTDEHDSPSYNLKKFYKYDIKRNSGFFKTRKEKIIDSIIDEVPTSVVNKILLPLLIFLLIFIGGIAIGWVLNVIS